MRDARIALVLALAVPAAAQEPLPPPPGSAHILTLDYAEDQVIPLQATPGYQVTVELSGDERIENVALGDSAGWQVTANKRGDHLFIKPLSGGTTNMTVVTDRRLYTFELSSFGGAGGQAVYAVRFRYPPPPGSAPPPMGATAGRYRLSGDHSLRPTAISDDGAHTYIQWPATVALPAVYAIDGDGRELVANGAMRDGTYVVDSVVGRLVFRRDRRTAFAVRLRPRRR